MALVTKSFSDIITFTRNSGATYFDSNGVLQTAGNNVPRLDYNPSTLAAQGLLIEEQRTNSIRNNTMVGAVAGTPGTLPTNWNIYGLGTLNQQVVAVSTINGINYIDLRFSGTTSTTQLTIRSEPGGTGAISAANGQTWSMSLWSAIVAGSLTNISGSGYGTLAYDGAGAFIGAPFSSGVLNTTSTLVRTQTSGTIATAGAAFIQPQIFLGFAPGVAIDITLRIGLPQLERGAFATSVIPTTTTALTRSADVASVNTLAPWFNSASGTLYAEYAVSGFASASVFPSTAALSDGTGNNRINLASTNTGASLYSYGEVQAGGAPQAGFYGASGSPFGVGTARKVAIAYAANDFAFTTQGLAVQADPSGTVPTVDRLYLGVGSTGTAQFQNGYLRRITYYPRRLSNAELVSITS